MQNFSGQGHQLHYEKQKEEKIRVKDYQRRQNRGNLVPQEPLPFKGESTCAQEFKRRKAEAVRKQVPLASVSRL